jgi:hypothetical protein
MTLYQRLLGPDFHHLPRVLQNFHGAEVGGRAQGRVTVRSGNGFLRQQVARALGLPPPAVDIPLQLEVVPEGEGERWIRYFGGHCIESVQWQEGEYLLERSGPIVFVFRVRATEMGLRFVSEQNRVRGLHLPGLLGVTATVVAEADDWNVEVQFLVPLLGAVTTYSGEVQPLR